jgi:hypothetical protein
MASYEILRRVALVRTDISEELSVSIIRVTRIGELGTTLAIISNRRTLRRNTKRALAYIRAAKFHFLFWNALRLADMLPTIYLCNQTAYQLLVLRDKGEQRVSDVTDDYQNCC